MVLAVFLWKPELLYSFDSISGRIVMLLAVVYLLRINVILGFVAALVMLRVLDQDKSTFTWKPSNDLLQIENLLRPKDSAQIPALRTTTTPINDVYEQYTLF